MGSSARSAMKANLVKRAAWEQGGAEIPGVLRLLRGTRIGEFTRRSWADGGSHARSAVSPFHRVGEELIIANRALP